jgi:hypothetical protein
VKQFPFETIFRVALVALLLIIVWIKKPKVLQALLSILGNKNKKFEYKP